MLSWMLRYLEFLLLAGVLHDAAINLQKLAVSLVTNPAEETAKNWTE